MSRPSCAAKALFGSVPTVPTEPDTEHSHSGERRPVVFVAAVSRSSTAADDGGRLRDSEARLHVRLFAWLLHAYALVFVAF